MNWHHPYVTCCSAALCCELAASQTGACEDAVFLIRDTMLVCLKYISTLAAILGNIYFIFGTCSNSFCKSHISFLFYVIINLICVVLANIHYQL